MPQLEFVKKIKRLGPPELSHSIFTFFFASVCIILCFFYFDNKALGRWFHFQGVGPSLIHTWFGSGDQRPGFLEEAGDGCDLFDGNWVWDESYPLYQSQDCLFVDDGFRCSENGRPDNLYTKWRWQPKGCNLPRFDAKKMLEKLQHRRLVFVGDSIGRNQWESLLCMLSSAVSNKTSIYEVNGSPITKHSGYLIFKFRDFNCTIEYYRSPFLVPHGHVPAGAPDNVKTTLRVDQVAWSSRRWRDADVLIFNAGHWWNIDKTLKYGCYFQVGEEVKMEMSVESAFQWSIETLMKWIVNEVNLSKTQVLFRSYSPLHFRDGDWNTSGLCHQETLPDLDVSPDLNQTWIHLKITTDVLSKYLNNQLLNKLDLLNVTYMTSLRKDGHSSIYYLGSDHRLIALNREDCSHWCLPGVPDSWNELLYAVFLKREHTRAKINPQAPV